MGRSAHCSPQERAIVLLQRNEGKSYSEIAKNIGRSKNMVANVISGKKSEGKRGLKRLTTPQMDHRIVRIAKKDPFKTASDIKVELALEISTRTIRRRLVEGCLYGRSARHVPKLSKKNVRDRMTFAKNHLDWNGPEGIKKWRNILWSDESKINMFGSDGKQYVRRPINKEFCPLYTKKTVKHGGGNIKVWGCFSYSGVGPLYWIKEIMDQHIYVDDILQNIMLPYSEDNMPLKMVFMQDNDPKHTSRKAKSFFEAHQINVLPWPAQSPDLNPIEHLWKDLKVAVSLKKPTNKQQLWLAAKGAWESIPVERCQQLIDSMPRRCQAVIKNKGQATKY